MFIWTDYEGVKGQPEREKVAAVRICSSGGAEFLPPDSLSYQRYTTADRQREPWASRRGSDTSWA